MTAPVSRQTLERVYTLRYESLRRQQETLRRIVQRAAETRRITPQAVFAYAALHLRTEDGRPIRPAPHHRLWIELICDERIKRLLIIAPPESAKPVSVDALVLMGDGSRKRLGDVQVGDSVITHTGQPRQVTHVHDQGVLPMVRITTYAGRVIDAAPDHPFLTPGGWVNAGDLVSGMALAVCTRPATHPVHPTQPVEAYRLAGYFIGDGDVTFQKNYAQNASIHCVDDQEAADIRHCAATLGFAVQERVQYSFRFSQGIRAWLRDTDLAGHRAQTKRVPHWIMTGTEEQIGHFLGAYFACDGYVNRPGVGRANPQIEISSVSLDLLHDIQHLCGRLGIATKIRQGHANYQKRKVLYYRITTNSREAVTRFMERCPIYHEKAQRLAAWSLYRTLFDEPYLPDPVETVEPIDPGPCRCLTVDTDHTFVANDVIVRNTTWIVSAYCGLYIGTWPERSIIIGSVSGPVAEKRSMSLRATIESQDWNSTFPGLSRAIGLPWRTNEWSLAPRGVPHPGRLHPTLAAYGTGGSVIGSRADMVIADDLLNDENSRTIGGRAFTEMWMHRSLLSRRKSRTGRTVVIGTAWHHDDLYNHLKHQGGWVVCHVPLLSDSESVYATLTYPDGFDGSILGEPVGTHLEGEHV